MEAFIDIFLLSLLGVTAIAVVMMRDLFGAVMLFGIYSLLSAAIFVTLDAVDVAFTEAAVGAGISTVLMLSTLALLPSRKEKAPQHSAALPFFVVLITGTVLLYATKNMPHFGDPEAPIHHHVAPRYIEDSPKEIGIPNMVTSVLASYRGFDTFGEVTVVFTAGIGVLTLIGGRRRKPLKDSNKE